MRYDCIGKFIIDGTPCAAKAARTVWMGGKPGDSFQRVTYPYFNTAKTLLDCEISDECFKAIKRIAQKEKEFLLPEVKPQPEE